MTTQEILKSLAEKHGAITPEIVIKYAKHKNSPLHEFFCWDDNKAGQLYRLDQARHMIRRIKVEYITENTKTVTVRAYHCVIENVENVENDVENDEEKDQRRGIYVPLDVAMSNYRDQIMDQCKRDMETFKRKYAALKEVAHVIDAMGEVA